MSQPEPSQNNRVQAAMLFAPGFEEVEALTVVDLLRRGEIPCHIISLEDSGHITGSHNISVLADLAFSQVDFSAYQALLLPGGQPGTRNLAGDERVLELLRRFHARDKLCAAICAAPTVLAKAGILEGKRAVCYPGLEAQLTGAIPGEEPVAVDGSIITSRGVGTAIPFALSIAAYFQGREAAEKLGRSIVYQ